MSSDDWLVIGIILGLLLGITIGYIIVQTNLQPRPSQPVSVLFERDREGRIVAIHYVNKP
ncbi:MAG: hypothetical protein QXL06_02075 [Nitrososphaerota archaeon]